MALAQAISTEPTVQLVRMTPKKASAMLAMNTNNRHLRPTVVGRYARDMASGDWLLNGETIKVASGGRILDGQHRLQAIVDSGVTLDMFVVFGLPDEAQDTVDRGMPRNIADALRLRGEVQCTALAASIAQAILLKGETPSQIAAIWPSTREALHFLDEHPSIRDSVKVADRVNKSVHLPGGNVGGLHFTFSEIDSEDADTFWNHVADGTNLEPNSPILRFREFALREISAPRRTSKTRTNALAIKAWNAWRRGDPMAMLRWKTGGTSPEVFPRPE